MRIKQLEQLIEQPKFHEALLHGFDRAYSLGIGRNPDELEWGDLTDAIGQTSQEGDDSFVIQVDRETNFSLWVDDELRDTVGHEACHIATWGAEQDDHGPRWQACMSRIKAQSDHMHN